LDRLESRLNLLVDQLFQQFQSRRTNGVGGDGDSSIPITEIFDFVRGVEPGSDAYSAEDGPDKVLFIRVGDLGKRPRTTFVDRALVSDRLLTPTDIVVTLDGSIGIVEVGLTGGYSSGIRKVVPRRGATGEWAFSYALLRTELVQLHLRKHARGTTIQHAGHGLDTLRVPRLSDQQLMAVDSSIGPVLSLLLNARARRAIAERTKDVLVPALVEGVLDSSALAIEP
jgi:hypothetical protein